MSFKIKLALGVLIFVFCVGIEYISYAGEQKSERRYRIPDGSLILNVPNSWSHEVSFPPAYSSLMPEITFKPDSGDSFLIMVTVFWDWTHIHPGFNSPEKLREITKKAGEKVILSKSVETELNLQELKGLHSFGYFYTVTDKALIDKVPLPGEYKYLTHGNLGVGNLSLMFSIFTNTKDSDVITDALEMLKNARQQFK